MSTTRQTPPLVFGIYLGGASAEEPASADRPESIQQALAQLQGGTGRPFRVRAYVEYHDAPCDATGEHHTPRGFLRYLRDGRRLDLVVQFQAPSGNVDGFAGFVRRLVAKLGAPAPAT